LLATHLPEQEARLSLRTVGLALSLIAAGLVACSKDDTQQTQDLTQREKDSVFARSQIPGAKAVGKALRTADSATARQARIDTSQAP
jgi:hypothetical protein